MLSNLIKPEDHTDEFLRIGGLSDALFAIVLTLLVLELKIPETLTSMTEKQVIDYLVNMWPRFFSFFLTFVVTSFYWIAHHWSMAQIKKVDRHFLWINLSFLLCISFFPYTTALLGERLSFVTWFIYGVNMALVGLTLTALWGYSLTQNAVSPILNKRAKNYATAKNLLSPGIFLVSLPIACFSPRLASFTPLLIAPLLMFLKRLFFSEPVQDEREHQTLPSIFWRLLGWLPIISFSIWSVISQMLHS